MQFGVDSHGMNRIVVKQLHRRPDSGSHENSIVKKIDVQIQEDIIKTQNLYNIKLVQTEQNRV